MGKNAEGLRAPEAPRLQRPRLRETRIAKGSREDPAKAEKHPAATDWGRLLAWRTGWHGFRTHSGYRLFYMVRHLSETYVLHLEKWRLPESVYYCLGRDFDLKAIMIPLGEFERRVAKEKVVAVHQFQVEGLGLVAARCAMAATGVVAATGAIEGKGDRDIFFKKL